MVQSNLVKINFCFPKFTTGSKKAFTDALIRDIRLDKKVGYAGYSHKKYLRKNLLYRFGDSSLKKYKPLSSIIKQQIEKTVQSTVQKCHKKLSLSTPPFFVFIFPWFPEKDDKSFGGVNGFAPYADTIHLFISPSKFSSRSLQETVAHELSHAVFFHYHPLEQTLLDAMIFEGLAENFREEIVGGSPAPWSITLTIKKTREMLATLKPSLSSKSYNLYREVFLKEGKYKRWTGYSIGYRIVKLFRKSNPKMSWEEIMRMTPKIIFNKSGFIKKRL